MNKGAFSVWFMLFLTVMLLSACATGNEATIRPLASIPGGFDGPQVQDIGPQSAKIVFTTTAPVVCNVAYGVDDNYGRLAVMAMAGPNTDHEVQLLGLEPGTTYHFRVAVTDLASNVYRSDDMTFVTAAGGEQAKPAGVNVAAASEGARIVGVSSNWGGGGLDSSFGGNKAIDGNAGTEWSSDGDGDGAWIEIELRQSFDLTALGFWTRTMGSTAQISSLSVVIDGSRRLGPFDVPDAAAIHYFDVDVRARHLRFEVEGSSKGNTGAVEIEVYTRR